MYEIIGGIVGCSIGMKVTYNGSGFVWCVLRYLKVGKCIAGVVASIPMILGSLAGWSIGKWLTSKIVDYYNVEE